MDFQRNHSMVLEASTNDANTSSLCRSSSIDEQLAPRKKRRSSGISSSSRPSRGFEASPPSSFRRGKNKSTRQSGTAFSEDGEGYDTEAPTGVARVAKQLLPSISFDSDDHCSASKPCAQQCSGGANSKREEPSEPGGTLATMSLHNGRSDMQRSARGSGTGLAVPMLQRGAVSSSSFDWAQEIKPFHYGCYSPTCPCKSGPSGTRATWPHCKCYSAACSRQHKQSYWKHPKLRRFLIRIRINAALSFRRPVDAYASFLPFSLQNHIVLANTSSDEPEARASIYEGCVLFADASGFTKLTEKLSRQASGAEQLCGILNRFFEILVDIIHKHGGDIIKFAGDALLILWTVGMHTDMVPTMRDAVLLASQCAVEIHKQLHNYEAAVIDGEPTYLSLHMGIGAGPFTSLHVGGLRKRMEYVIEGDPVKQIGLAEPLAEPGETVVSPQAWAHVKDLAEGTSVWQLQHLAAKDGKKRHAIEASEEHIGFMRLDRLVIKIEAPSARRKFPLKSRHIPLMQNYIPAAALPTLKTNRDNYIAEMRQVSVVFVKFENFVLDADRLSGGTQEAIDRGNALMLHVQRCIYSYEGSVNKFLIDDKGLLVLCVFGLFPLSHADDAIRAIHAARHLVSSTQDIIDQLSKPQKKSSGDGSSQVPSYEQFPGDDLSNVTCSVGVGTGFSFCGVVGSPSRREYTVMGRPVNLAARLMCLAKGNQVVVDKETKMQSEGTYLFESKKVELKGFQKKVETFIPTETVSKKVKDLKKAKKTKIQAEARSQEIDNLSSIVRNVAGGQVIVITGDRGSGKSTVVDQAIKVGKSAGYAVFKGDNSKKGKSKDDKPPAITSAPSSTTSSTLANQSQGAQTPSPLAAKNTFSIIPTKNAAINEAFSAWHEVIAQILKHGSDHAKLTKEQWVLASLEESDHEHAPLLQYVIEDLDISGELTRRKRGARGASEDSQKPKRRSRASSTSSRPRSRTLGRPYWKLSHDQMVARIKDIVVALINAFTVIDDLLILLHMQTGTQLMMKEDNVAWSLAHAVCMLCQNKATEEQTQCGEGKKRLVLFIATRSLVYNSSFLLEEIVTLSRRNNTLLQLRPLSARRSEIYLRRVLDASDAARLPEDLVAYFNDMAAGNPKHIEELAEELLNNNAIIVKDGFVFLNKRVPYEDVQLPRKMIGYVKSLLDMFQVRHQLIVKIASTCDFFTEQVLRSLVPYEEEAHHIPSVIADLVEAGIFKEVLNSEIPRRFFTWDPSSKKWYSFSSKLFRLLANKRLLSADRKQFEQIRNRVTVLHSAKNLIRLQTKAQSWLKSLSNKARLSRSLSLPNAEAIKQAFQEMVTTLIESVQEDGGSSRKPGLPAAFDTNRSNGEAEGGAAKSLQDKDSARAAANMRTPDSASGSTKKKATARSNSPLTNVHSCREEVLSSESTASLPATTNTRTQSFQTLWEEGEKVGRKTPNSSSSTVRKRACSPLSNPAKEICPSSEPANSAEDSPIFSNPMDQCFANIVNGTQSLSTKSNQLRSDKSDVSTRNAVDSTTRVQENEQPRVDPAREEVVPSNPVVVHSRMRTSSLGQRAEMLAGNRDHQHAGKQFQRRGSRKSRPGSASKSRSPVPKRQSILLSKSTNLDEGEQGQVTNGSDAPSLRSSTSDELGDALTELERFERAKQELVMQGSGRGPSRRAHSMSGQTHRLMLMSRNFEAAFREDDIFKGAGSRVPRGSIRLDRSTSPSASLSPHHDAARRPRSSPSSTARRLRHLEKGHAGDRLMAYLPTSPSLLQLDFDDSGDGCDGCDVDTAPALIGGAKNTSCHVRNTTEARRGGKPDELASMALPRPRTASSSRPCSPSKSPSSATSGRPFLYSPPTNQRAASPTHPNVMGIDAGDAHEFDV